MIGAVFSFFFLNCSGMPRAPGREKKTQTIYRRMAKKKTTEKNTNSAKETKKSLSGVDDRVEAAGNAMFLA